MGCVMTFYMYTKNVDGHLKQNMNRTGWIADQIVHRRHQRWSFHPAALLRAVHSPVYQVTKENRVIITFSDHLVILELLLDPDKTGVTIFL